MYLVKDISHRTYADQFFEDDFFTTRDSVFQYLGVDITREVVRLKKVAQDTLIYDVHAGLYAPRFKAVDLNGDTVTLDDYKGKYVYLDFWLQDDEAGVRRSMQMHNARAKLTRSKIEFLQFVELTDERPADFYRDKSTGWRQMMVNEQMNVLKNYRARYGDRNFLIDPNGKIILKGIYPDDLFETLYRFAY